MKKIFKDRIHFFLFCFQFNASHSAIRFFQSCPPFLPQSESQPTIKRTRFATLVKHSRPLPIYPTSHFGSHFHPDRYKFKILFGGCRCTKTSMRFLKCPSWSTIFKLAREPPKIFSTPLWPTIQLKILPALKKSETLLLLVLQVEICVILNWEDFEFLTKWKNHLIEYIKHCRIFFHRFRILRWDANHSVKFATIAWLHPPRITEKASVVNAFGTS